MWRTFPAYSYALICEYVKYVKALMVCLCFRFPLYVQLWALRKKMYAIFILIRKGRVAGEWGKAMWKQIKSDSNQDSAVT